MTEILGTVTVSDKWQTVGDIIVTNCRQIALFIDRYHIDSTGLELRFLAIEQGKVFPFATTTTNKNEISITNKHFHLNDANPDSVLVELLYDLFDNICIQVKAEKVGETPDKITIMYKTRKFK